MKLFLVGVFSLSVLGCTASAGRGPEKAIEVYRYDGSVQCARDSISLEAMAVDLRREGVTVLSQRKAGDGRRYSAVCGGRTGRINVFAIPTSDRPLAEAIGFRVLEGGALPTPR